MPRTLKDQLEADIAKGEAEEAAKPGLHDGTDWWQLSDAEEEVFVIDRERFIRMVMTWHCYEGFKLISHSPVMGQGPDRAGPPAASRMVRRGHRRE
jgi:hypothetical protein